MKVKRVDTRHTANDVSVWGDKKDGGNADYRGPFKVAGVPVDLDGLPAFGEPEPDSSGDEPRAPVRRSS